MVSGEDKTQYDALATSDIFEFFRLLTIHEKNQVAKMNRLKQINDGKNNTRSRK